MFDPIEDLKKARILVTNDDGIHAPGLKVLEKIAKSLSKDVIVVAPEVEHSGAGHSLTIRRPLRVRRLSKRRFAVDGTPTDCVLLAVQNILKTKKPDLVLSGVNRGGNLGEDVTYSGTVAAAMEATLLGIPAIAFSQMYTGTNPVKWDTAAAFAPKVVKKAVSVGWSENVLINVNFPDVAVDRVVGIEVTSQGQRSISDLLEERIDPRGQPYVWIGGQKDERFIIKGTDLEAAYRGAISVTPLYLNLTHGATMDRLRQAF